ncbi:MAG: TVP38/TMEM64 family protein [Deltaproteobacteria bacterium]|nr:TVP38/TMEM64 family protein [Deltaproteobacteria bacterium]
MIRFDKRTVIDLVILGAVIVGITLLLYALDLFHLFTDKDRMLSLIEEHRAYAVFIFIGLQVIQVLVAILPGEVTGFVGGIFFGPLWGIIFSTVGLTLGSWIAFNLAHLFGRPLIDIIVRQETIKRFDYVMKHKGLFLAFLLFLIPGFPKDILCYLLGLGHMRQGEFLIISIAGRLLGTTLLTIGGSFFRDERYGALFTVVGISIGVILIVLIYRAKIEGWFKAIHAAKRIKAYHERRRSKKKHRSVEKTQNPKST